MPPEKKSGIEFGEQDMEGTILAVRGAAGVEETGDEAGAMRAAIGELFEALERANGFEVASVVSVQFTQTPDLRKKNAAGALREARPEYGKVPLFCSQEAEIEGAPGRLVRVLVTWRGQAAELHPVYLGRAAALRPDLSGNGA